MKVENLSGNNNYPRTNFCSKYIVSGSVEEGARFMRRAEQYLGEVTYIMLNGSSSNRDVMLICTDELSKNALYRFKKRFIVNGFYSNKVVNKFMEYPVTRQLKQIFGKKEAKQVKKYNLSDILNSNFDFKEGIII